MGCLRQVDSDMRWPWLRNEDNEEVKKELLRKDQLKYKSIEWKLRGISNELYQQEDKMKGI